MGYDFGGAWDARLAQDVEEYYGCEDFQTKMNDKITFQFNGEWYCVEVWDWQTEDNLENARFYKRDAVGCWYEIFPGTDSVENACDAAYAAVEKAWKDGDYITEADLEAQNDWD